MIPRAFLILAAAVSPSALLAVPIAGDSLTFDGLQNGEQVLSYYDGGFGSLGSGPGPLYGVSFTSGLAADSTTIAFGPSAQLTAPSITMDLDSAWPGPVSFYFVGDGEISFYSGKDATGTLLGSFPLTYAGTGFGDPFGGEFGSFQSVVFSRPASGSLLLDSITFGGLVVPEPAAAALLAAGMISMLLLRRYRVSILIR